VNDLHVISTAVVEAPVTASSSALANAEYEPDARVELRKTSDPFLDARHAYEHHASRALVKDGPHLFETVHLKDITTNNS